MSILSVIIPIYNVDAYLNRCLRSIQRQTISDFKCILVDDGSTDHSTEIAQKFCQIDRRFKLIKTTHYSLAHAQNLALKNISSPFVTFCDGDDYWDKDAYQKFSKFLNEKNDLIISDMYIDYSNKKIIKQNLTLPEYMNQNEIIKQFPKIYKQNIMFYDTNKIYRTAIIKNVLFKNTTVGLDTMFNYEIFPKCNNIYFNKDAYYHYCQHLGSLVHHFDKKRLSTRKKETAALDSLLKKWHYPSYSQKLINQDWFNNLLFSIKNIYMPNSKNKIIPLEERLEMIHNIFKECIKHINYNELSSKEKHFIDYLTQLKNNDQCLFNQWIGAKD